MLSFFKADGFTVKYLLFLLLFVAPLSAQTFHAILIGDTTDLYVGSSSREDLKLINQKLNEMIEELNLPLKKTLIVGKLVNPSFILSKIQELEFEEDDIVFFYFSGHGFRTETKTSIWPNLLCSNTRAAFDLKNVIDIIEEKNPRLKLFVTDVCNNILKEEKAPMLISHAPLIRSLSKTNGNVNLAKLFLHTSGTIVVTSSQIGEFAYCTKSGGFFTKSLITSIEKAALLNQASWEDVLQKASEETEKRTEGSQHPDFLISIE